VNDPKYKFGDSDRLYHRDGNYFIDNNEPVMVLRSKDITSLAAIVSYIETLLGMPCNPAVDDHIKSATERLHAFYMYQKNNTHLQSVGCNRSSHRGGSYILTAARELLSELDPLGRLHQKHKVESRFIVIHSKSGGA